MAKLFPKPVASDSEAPVVLMRKVGPERFEIVTGFVRGALVVERVLETSVSLQVGRGTARKALAELHRRNSAALGLTADS